MIASPLRELARRYSRQEMSLAAYREQRADYLEDLVARKIKLSYRDTLSTEQIDAQLKPTFAWADWRSYTDFSDQRIRFGAIALVGAIITLSIVLYEPPPPPPAPIEAIVIDPTGIDMVKGLLAEEIWSDASLRDFADAWMSLSEEQRRFARLDPSFRRFRGRINQLIQDQEALAGLGDDQAAAYALQLTDLLDRIQGA